jgi:hypothetical protein
MFDLSNKSHLQHLQSLYVAPAALGDYCDSSGCLPGQIPLPGLKAKAVINKSAELTMNQVCDRFVGSFSLHMTVLLDCQYMNIA